MEMTLQTLTSLAAFVFIASLKGALLVVVVLFMHKAAGKHLTAGARYLLWFPVIIALLTPVGIELRVPTELIALTNALVSPALLLNDTEHGQVSSASLSSDSQESADSTPLATDEVMNVVATHAARGFSWPRALAGMWLGGVAAMLGAIALSCLRFNHSVHHATHAPQALQGLLKECMAQTSCKAAVSVMHSSATQAPMIGGLFAPVLLLPEAIERQLTREQLRHVLIHELMHLQRSDIVSNWIVALTQALHWFNPAIWFAFYCMRQDRELACDAATLRHLAPADRVAYGHTLLRLNDVSARVPSVALGILASPSHLQRRIYMLVRSSRPGKLQSFCVGASMLALAAVATSQPMPVPAAVSQITVVDSAATGQPAPIPPTPATPAVSATSIATTRPPAVPRTEAIPVPSDVEQAQSVAAEMQTGPVPEIPPTAQVEVAPVVDAFTFAAEERTDLIAAVTDALPRAAAESAAEVPPVVMQMTEELSALKALQLHVIDEWNGNALACEARKEDSLFGTLSKPCREVRVVQLRGDVFRFVYACHVLGLQQRVQRAALREAVAQRQAGMAAVEATLLANERELETLCSQSAYANEYPGFSNMLADAAALKYYNPWRQVPAPNVVPSPYGPNYDPMWMSRMTDMPPPH
jgi:beta-lactamase regulating signal transducer with metallopeptidase domain